MIGRIRWVALAAVVAGCTSDFDTTRVVPPRGTIGREIFTVLCDRVGANALREDVLGASYHARNASKDVAERVCK